MKRVIAVAAFVALAAGVAAQGQQQRTGGKGEQASCRYFVDADNDGICDNAGAHGQGWGMRGKRMRGFGGGMAFGPAGQSLVGLTAKVTGQEPAAVIEALRSGKTFAEIAGPSVDALKQQVLAERQRTVAAAVAEGRLAQAQADEMIARMTEHIDARLNGSAPMRPAGRRGLHRGPGPGGER